MRTFKQTYKDRAGKLRKTARWYLEWRDDGQLRRLPGFTSKAATDELGRRVETLRGMRAVQAAPDLEMTRFLERLPDDVREALVRFGLLEARRVAGSRPLSEHLADFKAALLAKGNTERHATLTESRVRRVVEGCGFKVWSDISASRVQAFIAGLREDRRNDEGKPVAGVGAATFNYYLQSFKAFCRWMVKDGRASESAVAHLSGVNTRTDRRVERRALEAEELRWLLTTAAEGPERRGMSGAERAMAYRVAVETGLRVSELRSLTRASFRLTGDEPTVTVEAGYSKRRREDVLPLRSETAAALADFLRAKAPAAPAFALPTPTQTAAMLRADLAAARAAWLSAAPSAAERERRAGAGFLAERDAAGRVVDFHALRHTFITSLARGGVHPKTAQALARHSTITLTMDRYSHSLREAEAAALSALPDLSAPASGALRATGTHGASECGGTPPLSMCAAGSAGVGAEGVGVDRDGHNPTREAARECPDSSGETSISAGEKGKGRGRIRTDEGLRQRICNPLHLSTLARGRRAPRGRSAPERGDRTICSPPRQDALRHPAPRGGGWYDVDRANPVGWARRGGAGRSGRPCGAANKSAVRRDGGGWAQQQRRLCWPRPRGLHPPPR